MEYWIGAVLALAVGLSSTFFGFDRDRVFYPTVMIVIASSYGLFAVMGGSTRALIGECVLIAVFYGLSVLGFKRNLWIIVGALFAHGLFDYIHGRVISNPGVPVWWPGFCLTYDIVAAAYLAFLLMRSRLAAHALT
jgi:hypothetical protein